MLQAIRSLWRAAVRRGRFERDMDDELRFHVESRAADLVAHGVPPGDAARRARIEFGNPAVYRDRCRDSRRLTLVDDLRGDVRFALRATRKDAALSLTIVATLALGIGATAAMFTAVNAALLRPLPFADPSQLVMVFADGDIHAVPGPDFVEWREGCGACAGMAAFTQWESTIAGGVEAERVLVGRVTPELFSTLGIQPLLGRTFLPSEMARSDAGIADRAAVNAAVILGAGVWRRQFQSDPAIVGRTIRVDSAPTLVVGVMPDGFAFPDRAEAWVPADVSTTRRNAYLQVLARLKPGTSAARGAEEFKALIARSEVAQPDERRIRGVRLVPLQEHLVGDVRTSLAIFLAAVGLVLLIACANVANLLLAQAATRPREMAIRTILGAGRARLVRQLLTESLLLAVAGGLAGLLLTAWILTLFRGTLPEAVPRLNAIAVDRSVVAFVACLSIATGVLFGLVPALRSAKPDLHAALKAGTARGAGGPQGRRVRGALVVAELSLALMLLMGAGLLLKSFVLLRARPLGFDPRGVMTASVTLPEAGYAAAAQSRAYLRDALDRLGARTDVEAAGVTTALPLSRHGTRIRGDATVDGESEARRGAFPAKIAIGGEYFAAMRIPILRGRALTARDDERAPAVAVVSESFANRVWPGQNPLGRRVSTGFGAARWAEVVGVAGDVKHDGLRQDVSQAVYHPFAQIADSRRWFLAEMTFIVRSASPAIGVGALRDTLQGLDRDLPLYAVAPMRDVVAANASDPRFYALLMGSFSLVAFVLAIAGVYGVVSYSARQRTHELGVRVALGARRRDIAALVLGEGLALIGLGTTLGVAGAYAATRTLERFLFRVTVTDPATFITVPLVLCAVALAASYIPARRATAVDPLRALRYE
jgi:putative ABC transport system permease protein